MIPDATIPTKPPQLKPVKSRRRPWVGMALGLVLLYLVAAYGVLPLVWRAATRHHPDVSSAPRITQTANGIPGDPVKVRQ